MRMLNSPFPISPRAVTWSCEEEEDGQCVKVLVVPSDKLDQDTAAAISAVSQGSTGALRIKMHNKLAALVVPGKYLGCLTSARRTVTSGPTGFSSIDYRR